jgi:hypothetical protein
MAGVRQSDRLSAHSDQLCLLSQGIAIGFVAVDGQYRH